MGKTAHQLVYLRMRGCLSSFQWLSPGTRRGVVWRGMYLLTALFLPGVLAPSTCKRNPEHLHQSLQKIQILGTTTTLGGALLHLSRQEILSPVARGSQDTCLLTAAWPFKSSGKPTANTSPHCQHKASNHMPWGCGKK